MSDDRTISRRDALARLGLGFGLGSLAGLAGAFGAAGRTVSGATGSAAPGVSRATAIPGSTAGAAGRAAQAPIVRTLLGDFPAGTLPRGAILFHEHLSMKFPIGSPTHFTDDVDWVIEEVQAAQAEGVGVIVDGGHPDMGRNLESLRRIATATRMPIVASGGFYMERAFPADLAAKSATQLADELVADAGRNRLGAFGEIGQQGGVLTDNERKVFEAVGRAAAATGLPVFTHNAYSVRATTVPRDGSLIQLDLLLAAGANPANICIGHMCCLDDPAVDVAIQIARRGAFVGFDRVGLNATMPDANRVQMAIAFANAGYADRLLLSSDFYSAGATKRNGGAGIALTKTRFAPMLVEAGMPEATVTSILEENPRRFLAFVPKA